MFKTVAKKPLYQYLKLEVMYLFIINKNKIEK